MSKAPPLLSLRPKFDPGLTVVESIPLGLVGAVTLTFLVGTPIFILLSLIGLSAFISLSAFYGLFFVLGLALCPAAYYEAKKFAYKNTFYHFYEDWLEYQDFKFFLIKRRNRVRLRNVSDVFESASPLQARRVLASIYVAVPGMDIMAQSRGGFSGLKIIDIPENSGLREKIIDLVEESVRRYYQAPAIATPPVEVAATGTAG